MKTTELELQKISEMIRLFENNEGRRPRIMIENIASKEPDFSARQMASGFADLGFDVDISPVFHSAQELARQALENDVHFIGLISRVAIEESLLNELSNNLNMMNCSDIIIICLGDFIISDVVANSQNNTIKFFHKSTSIAEVASTVLKLFRN